MYLISRNTFLFPSLFVIKENRKFSGFLYTLKKQLFRQIVKLSYSSNTNSSKNLQQQF